MEHAPRVCHTCKARKKRCDKALPQCGYCTARDLICSYDESDSCLCDGHSVRRRAPQHQDISAQTNSYPDFLFDLRLLSAPTQTLDQVLNLHVCRVRCLTGLSVREISERFFQKFYRWLPILSPALFNSALTSYEDIGQSLYPLPQPSPLADFSLLILALYLITWRRSSRTAANKTSFSLESLYMTVRTLFGQIQAAKCASTTLVQAGLLIAAYDYAIGRPHSAYILMGTCGRMALTLGLDKAGRNGLSPDLDMSDLRAREEYMVWWALIVLERHILCEIPEQNWPLATRYLSDEAVLPSYVHSLQVNENNNDDSSFNNATAIKATHSLDFTCFTRLAHVSYLLDQILCAMNLPEQERHITIRELIKLDCELQGVLVILTKDSGHEWSFSCSAIGTAVRSLFILHKYILSQYHDYNHLIIQQSSRAALTTVTKIMVDVAHDHLLRVTSDNVDALPLTCLYNLRSAIENIRNGEYLTGTFLAADMESLIALDNMITNRWYD